MVSDIPKEVELREGNRVPSKRLEHWFKLLWKSAETGEINYTMILMIVNLVLLVINIVVSYARV